MIAIGHTSKSRQSGFLKFNDLILSRLIFFLNECSQFLDDPLIM